MPSELNFLLQVNPPFQRLLRPMPMVYSEWGLKAMSLTSQDVPLYVGGQSQTSTADLIGVVTRDAFSDAMSMLALIKLKKNQTYSFLS